MEIRKTVIIKETIEADGLGEACGPITRVVAMAVVRNPFAGRHVAYLAPLFDLGVRLGERLMGEAVALLAGAPVFYGKAGVFHRVVASGLSSRQSARELCRRLRAEEPGAFCQVLAN